MCIRDSNWYGIRILWWQIYFCSKRNLRNNYVKQQYLHTRLNKFRIKKKINCFQTEFVFTLKMNCLNLYSDFLQIIAYAYKRCMPVENIQVNRKQTLTRIQNTGFVERWYGVDVSFSYYEPNLVVAALGRESKTLRTRVSVNHRTAVRLQMNGWDLDVYKRQ